MLHIVIKYLITAAIIVAVTEVQKVSDRLSALLIALPLTSLIAMIWMHYEGQETRRIANHAEGTFWFVLPTLPMFLMMPWMLRMGWSFWLALGANVCLTAVLFWIMIWTTRMIGMKIL